MSDKVETPGSTPATPGQSEQVDPKAYKDLQAKHAALEAENATLKTQYAKERTVMGRMANELGVLRQKQGQRAPYNPGAIDYGTEFGGDPNFDPAAANGQDNDPARTAAPHVGLSTKVDNLAYETSMVRFRQDFPGAAPRWAKIMEIVNDPAKAAEFVRTRADGSVDFYGSFRAIDERLELDERRAADAAREQQAQATAEQKAGINRLAQVSGGGSHETPQTLTIEQIRNDPAWTPERIRKEFPEAVDAANPGA